MWLEGLLCVRAMCQGCPSTGDSRRPGPALTGSQRGHRVTHRSRLSRDGDNHPNTESFAAAPEASEAFQKLNMVLGHSFLQVCQTVSAHIESQTQRIPLEFVFDP